MPPEILSRPDEMETMAVKHLDVNEWGTSNPIYDRLRSSHSDTRISKSSLSDFNISGGSPFDDPTVGGIFTTQGVDSRTLTEINCGEGSYLERVSEPHTPLLLELLRTALLAFADGICSR